MKKGIKYGMWAFTILVIVVIGFFVSMTIHFRPTKGEPVPTFAHPHKALLVIDVQPAFMGDRTRYPKQDEVIARINAMQQQAQADSVVIVHIRQEFNGILGTLMSKMFLKGKGREGQPGTEMDSRILPLAAVAFPKHIGDAFSNPDLQKFLNQHEVNELVLTGMDAEFCVHQTAQGALNRGYKVSVVPQALLMGNMGHWDKVMAKYRSEGIQIEEVADSVKSK
jgi:nicotinamidase-related amidase